MNTYVWVLIIMSYSGEQPIREHPPEFGGFAVFASELECRRAIKELNPYEQMFSSCTESQVNKDQPRRVYK